MINFIFFGRTTQEKWIDLILEVFSRLSKEWINTRRLDIFGDGQLATNCILASKNNRNIVYHGRAAMSSIVPYLRQADYSLTPSFVVETFWKSALSSLQYGVPIIGFSKWWLAQFMDPWLAIEKSTPAESLYQICKNIILGNLHPNKTEIQKRTLPYDKKIWISIIQKYFGDHTSILHVSDFTSKIWGIELFLRESKYLLEKNWYTVDLFGHNKKVSFWWLFSTAFNIISFKKLQQTLREFAEKNNWKHYDVIRFHSLLRYLWWTVLYHLPKKSKKVFMVHDLWYFHPYPSKLYSTKDIPEFSLSGFLSKWVGIRNKILIFFKFISLWIIQKKLSKIIDIWFVPSVFLIDVLHLSWGIPKEKIALLPHFA